MSFFGFFNKVSKEVPNPNEVIKIPKHIKEVSENSQLNKICIRYFDSDFKNSVDIIGEIQHKTNIPLVIFEKPFKGAILLINDTVYNNLSKDNEKTIDIVEGYPFGLDKKSDLIKFKDVEYYRSINEDINFLNNSQQMYYKKEYKFYIPVMLNKIPLPIIKLDNAERYKPIDSNLAKRLANISQSFLREFTGIRLMERTTNKDSKGAIFIAILFTMIGFVLAEFIGMFAR